MGPLGIAGLGYGAQAASSGLQSILGHRGKFKQLPTMTPQQQQQANWAGQYGQQQIQNPYQGFEPIAKNMQSMFQQNIVPSLAERFSSMGSGNALSSGAFGSQLAGASRDFQGDLAAMMAQYGLQQQGLGQSLFGMGQRPQFENAYIPGGNSGIGAMFGSLGQAGGAFGQAGAMGYMDQAMNPMMNQSMRGQTPMAGSTAKSELERLRSPAYRKAYSPRSMAQNDLMQPQLAGY